MTDYCKSNEDEEQALSLIHMKVYSVAMEVRRLESMYTEDLKLPRQPDHNYIRERLENRVLPCRTALSVLEAHNTEAILAEVKNVLRLEGYTEARPSCGLNLCRCHLRILTSFLAEYRDDELVNLEEEIAEAEDSRHLANYASISAWKVLDAADLQKRIAEEMVEEYKWETNMDPEVDGDLLDLQEIFQEKDAAKDSAKAAYAAATEAMDDASDTFYKLVEQRKAKFKEMEEEDE